MAEGSGDEISNDNIISENLFYSIMNELFTSPLNLLLLATCAFLLIKIISASKKPKPGPPPEKLPKLAKQDFTLELLKKYDGKGPQTSICVAVNGKVFDVTRGKKHYGPDGPYHAFAGHDASRALATFNVNDVRNEYDDMSDLSSVQMDSVREWEMQFNEKYDYVGRLLKPGEQPMDYSEDEENKTKESINESSDNSSMAKLVEKKLE